MSKNSHETIQKDVAFHRQPEEVARIEEHTIRWLAALTVDMRPENLINDNPRIANKIALCWQDHSVCQKYLSELLMDPKRLNRKGFPFPILNEISNLQNFITASKADPTLHKDGIFRS